MQGRWSAGIVHRLIAALAIVASATPALVMADAPSLRPPVVLAAASLQPAMEEVAQSWRARGHNAPVLSFAGSSALARQIEAGAPADLFIAADEDWADYLQRRGLIDPRSRVDLLGNALVLVTLKTDTRKTAIRPGFPLAKLLGAGRLALADPDVVPAGKYAKQSLLSLRVWDSVARKLAPAENVRAAMALVERGQAPLGIVYATDTKGSAQVRVMGIFPEGTHKPIRYPMMTIARSRNPEAQLFRRYLMSAPARAIFLKYGFTVR